MIVEKKNNLFEAITQIIKLYEETKSDNYYCSVGVIRTVNNEGESYDVEFISDVFDWSKTNDTYILHDVVNICPNTINVNSLVYLSYIEKNVPIIIAAKDLDTHTLFASTSINLSGTTILNKIAESLTISDKDDKELVKIVPESITTTIKEYAVTADTIGLTGNKGASIAIEDSIEIKNSIASLKDLFSDLVSALNQNVVPDCTLVAPYGAGTGVALAAALTQLTTKINGLLK
jgi:hypothetical protein